MNVPDQVQAAQVGIMKLLSLDHVQLRAVSSNLSIFTDFDEDVKIHKFLLDSLNFKIYHAWRDFGVVARHQLKTIIWHLIFDQIFLGLLHFAVEYFEIHVTFI